jgi:hypothetical protein
MTCTGRPHFAHQILELADAERPPTEPPPERLPDICKQEGICRRRLRCLRLRIVVVGRREAGVVGELDPNWLRSGGFLACQLQMHLSNDDNHSRLR